ncbi:cupin domain-containing protein [Blastococcus sp. SYSU D00813]
MTEDAGPQAWWLTTTGDDGYRELVRVPDLSVGVYRIPVGGHDPQGPHTEDEVYTVVRGQALLELGTDRVPVRAGSVVFVPARVGHRFVEITEDLCVVVAFGPAERSRVDGAHDVGPRP